MRAEPCRVLILGVGNLLMGDEGAGIHAIRLLEGRQRPDGVRLMDGGTGGLTLLEELQSAEAVILIDATRDGSRPGSLVYRYRRHGGFGDLPPALSGHEFGLKDLFAAAQLQGRLPAVHLFTVAVTDVRPMCTELSQPVATGAAAAAAAAWSLAHALAT